MIKKKRTEIMIEAERTLVFTRRPTRSAAWCPECRAEVALVDAFEAAALADVGPQTVYRWAEGGRLHCRLTRGGSLLVCAESLPKGSGTA